MKAIARDQVEVMAARGFDRSAVVGHDRGARCAYRMTLDHPAAVSHLAVLDVVPTGEVAERLAGDVGLLFPGLFGGVRNPSNANRDLKEVLTRIDAERFGWVTSHASRKTVATRLDDAGLSARAIADHLGHAKPR